MASRRRRTAAGATRPRDDLEGSPWRRALVWLVIAKLALIILFFFPWGSQAFDLPKSVASRSVAWAMAGVLIGAIVRHGPAIVPLSRIHVAVGGYVAAVAVSSLLAVNPYIALFGEWDRFQGISFTLDMVVLYAAIVVAFRTDEDRLRLFAAIGAAGSISAAYALMQWTGRDVLDLLGLHVAQADRPRPYGPFGNSDVLGHFVSASVGAAAAFAAFDTGRVRRLALGCGALLLAAGVVSATRGLALGLAAVVLTISVLALRRGTLHRLGTARVMSIGLGLAVVSALILALTPLGTRIVSTVTLQAGVRDRLLIYESAFRMFLDRPLFGVGPDNFGAAYPPYRLPGTAEALHYQYVNAAHDWVLQVAATLGLAGLLAWLVLLAFAIWTLARDRSLSPSMSAALLAALAGYLAHALVGVGSVSIDWMPWLALAFAARASAYGSVAVEPIRWPSWVPSATVAIAVAMSVLALTPLVADAQAWRAQRALAEGTPRSAIPFASAATALDPGRAEYWSLLGSAALAAGQPGQASAAFEEATRRVPTRARHWQDLARSRDRLALGGTEPEPNGRLALDAARRAVQAAPNDPEPYYVQAIVALDQKDYALAMRSVVDSLRLGSPFTNDAEIAVAAARAWADRPAAIALLEEALRYRDSAPVRLALDELRR